MFKAIIPARGGSKGISRKNLQLLQGIPLIAYPILAAQKSKEIGDIYVSTEDKEIAKIALSYGAQVIDRPLEFAQDTSDEHGLFIHAVSELKDYSNIVHLRATTPLISPEVLDCAIKFFKQYKKQCTSMRSAHKCSETIYKFFRKDGDFWKNISDEFPPEAHALPRQQLPDTYNPNGYIDIICPNYFMKAGNSLHGTKILSYITPHILEIDSLEDLALLRLISEKTR